MNKMLENIFITGTSNNLIVQMGNNTTILGSNNYYHAATHNQPKSSHVSNLSAFSAPLICSFAKTKLNHAPIETVLICLRIPKISSFFGDSKDKSIEESFHTEWFFSLDLIRKSLELFQHKQEMYQNKNEPFFSHRSYSNNARGRLIICIPHISNRVSSRMLNETETIYYKSLCTTIHGLATTQHTPHEIALLYTYEEHSNYDAASTILSYVDKIQRKPLRKRILHQLPLHKRIFYRHIK